LSVFGCFNEERKKSASITTVHKSVSVKMYFVPLTTQSRECPVWKLNNFVQFVPEQMCEFWVLRKVQTRKESVNGARHVNNLP